MENNKSFVSELLNMLGMVVVIAGVAYLFFKLPSVVADKISYKQLQKKTFKQDLSDDEEG